MVVDHWEVTGHKRTNIGKDTEKTLLVYSASILDRDPEIVVQMHSRVFVMLLKTGATHVYPKWVTLGKIVEHWKPA